MSMIKWKKCRSFILQNSLIFPMYGLFKVWKCKDSVIKVTFYRLPSLGFVFSLLLLSRSFYGLFPFSLHYIYRVYAGVPHRRGDAVGDAGLPLE
jgi:hypothetical protein